MTEREVTPRLPTSGQIIGAVVSKLGIKHPKLQSRTARRYFAADLEHLVKDSTRAEIIGAIAEVLTDSGLSLHRHGRVRTTASRRPRWPLCYSGTRTTGTCYGRSSAGGR